VDELALTFFPYPHVFRGERRQGVAVKWPDICSRCDRQCEDSQSVELEVCSYGLNYQRVDGELLVAGLVVRDFPRLTEASRKRFRALREDAITTLELRQVIEAAEAANVELDAEARRRMDAIVAEFRASQGYYQEVVELLRPDLERVFAQVHDYKQFVQQIVQNISFILESRFPGIPFEEKLDQASQQEQAIYWAAVLMDERLEAVAFLEAPERIKEPREQRRFRLHGLVHKYIRIYESRAMRKELLIATEGDSWGDVEGNARAFGIIPHTLLDNAIKYAPRGTRIVVRFVETKEWIDLSVEGFGPKIEPAERTRIFDLFFRAKAARRLSDEGTGFGLASAQNIARAHDTEIAVHQGSERGPEGTYLTTFTVRIPRASSQQQLQQRRGSAQDAPAGGRAGRVVSPDPARRRSGRGPR
jgi:signal transduction histidine kinase